MAKKKKGKRKAPSQQPPSMSGGVSWQAKDGFHALLPGSPPTPEKLEELTKQYQENIRNSPMWGEMVGKFGRAKAEELLKECRVELRPPKTGIFSRVLGFFLR
jgi:hypothetical protein